MYTSRKVQCPPDVVALENVETLQEPQEYRDWSDSIGGMEVTLRFGAADEPCSSVFKNDGSPTHDPEKLERMIEMEMQEERCTVMEKDMDGDLEIGERKRGNDAAPSKEMSYVDSPLSFPCMHKIQGCNKKFANQDAADEHSKACIFGILRCCYYRHGLETCFAKFPSFEELMHHWTLEHKCASVNTERKKHKVRLQVNFPKRFFQPSSSFDFNVKHLVSFRINHEESVSRLAIIAMVLGSAAGDEVMQMVPIIYGKENKSIVTVTGTFKLKDAMGKEVPIVGIKETEAKFIAFDVSGEVFGSIMNKRTVSFFTKDILSGTEDRDKDNPRIKIEFSISAYAY